MEKQDYSINKISMIFQNMDKCGLRLTKPELDLCEECTNGFLCQLFYSPCPAKLVYTKLSQYEDTGLIPEEVQQMRWIPVEERLPDKPGHYLVCTNVNYWHGGCMDKNGSSSNAGTTDGYAGTTLSVLDCFYDITGDWNRVCNAHVTHWMPLPSPPKEENKDD